MQKLHFTKQEAGRIEELWGKAEVIGDYSYNPYYFANERIKAFYISIQDEGREAEFTLKAYKFILDKQRRIIPSNQYIEDIKDILTKSIAKLEDYQRAVEAGEIPSIEITNTPTEETPTQQEVPAPEDVQALRKRITELEEVNEQQQAEIQELTIKNAELETQIPKNGRPSNSGLNRYERTALLIELLAGVAGLDAQTLTGADEKIQGKKETPLSDACCLIADIASSQGHNVLSWHREYQRGKGHKGINESRMKGGRSHITALIQEIQDKQNKTNKTA